MALYDFDLPLDSILDRYMLAVRAVILAYPILIACLISIAVILLCDD